MVKYLELLDSRNFNECKDQIKNLEVSNLLKHRLKETTLLLESPSEHIELIISPPENDSQLDIALYYLNTGLRQFYIHGDETGAFSSLKKSLSISKDLKIQILSRICYRELLTLQSYYVSNIGDESFNYFLKEFKETIKDSSDLNEYRFYEFKLNLKFKKYSLTNENYYISALKDINEVQDSLLRANIYLTAASYNFHTRKHADSAFYYLQMAEFYLKNPIDERIAERKIAVRVNRSSYLNKTNMPVQALEILRSIGINRKGYLFNLANLYVKNNIWDAHKLIGNQDSILVSKSNYLEARLMFNLFSNQSLIADLETKYQTAEKEKQILVEKQRAVTNRNWLIAACLAILFGSGIAILLQQNTSKKRKLAEQEALLEQQKVATLLKEQELTSIDAMIAGQEKERAKVANELHDDLGSLMATVKLHFDNVKVDQKDPALMNAQKLLDEAYQKIRGMAHAKNSGVMASQGLLPAVKKMAKTINKTNALEVTVEDFGLGERMENSLELTIFRMLQELVANIIKHAEATTASIQFTQHEERLNIIVEDNGKGFDMSEVQRTSSGMGLGTIEKRIEHLEGTFTVDSVLGKGTSILIDIPV